MGGADEMAMSGGIMGKITRRRARAKENVAFFNCDLAEGVHTHLHVGQLDAGAVARDADADRVVDDALHSH